VYIKEEARRLIESLPENATWDGLMYKIYVRQAREAGLQDNEAGRVIDVEAVGAKFGLSIY
jgi:predicted transcriptional regulator